MYEEDDVPLISSNHSNYKRRGVPKTRDEADEQMIQLSDSEHTKGADFEDDILEETAMFSDSLYGDSLPSMRAQLAASQMQQRKRNTGTAALTPRENETLLSSGEDILGSVKTVINKKAVEIDSNGHYSSLGGKIVGKKRARKDMIKKHMNYFKVGSLTFFTVACVILFAVNPEHEEESRYLTLRNDVLPCDMPFRSVSLDYTHDEIETWKFVTVDITGPFLDSPCNSSSIESCPGHVFVCGMPHKSNCTIEDQYPNEWCHSFQLAEGYNGKHPHANYTKFTKSLDIHTNEELLANDTELFSGLVEEEEPVFSIKFVSAVSDNVEFEAVIYGEILEQKYQVVLAAIILVWVYILIGFDIVHRTMAAFIGSTCTLGVLSMISKRPTLEEVVEWLDLDTICLLFGMMTLVGIFSQTGFFDYSAVKAYKFARGKVWPLITLLCLFSAVVSAFLDNVTTILLLTPVSIRLCQVLNLDPLPVLIAEVVFSNIGGTATAIGDPPNVIIISNTLIKSRGITFPEFTLHLFLGVLIAMVAAYLLLTLIYYVSFIRVKNKDPPHVAELKREVAIWERTAQRLNVVSLEERAVRDAILAKAMDVRNQLNQEVVETTHSSKDLWQKNLAELESKYRITNWVLLIKSTVVLVVVILMFFLSNIIPKVELELGWIAIFGAVVLLLLSDIQDLESVLHKIEWGTLLFFAGLFVLMEGLGELGLISFIGDIIVNLIKNVSPSNQMLVAILLVLWVSAIASSFIDNIPFTTATIPVIWELANSPDLCLSLKPLVWALAMGACLGGNGTLIGASANVVCAGIAEQNGYKISFISFFKIGFPMMLVTTFTSMLYLLFCHEWLGWNTSEARACVEAKLINDTTALFI